ncbi:MAG: helix-turn-helix domain-containing protein [Bacteroidetes bacterium]|nr:helix-turn-helix domain-containing protein [Bacteroidota bacterium]
MKQQNKPKRQLIFDQDALLVFAEQLKKLRHDVGITQTQLAFEAGISLSQVARIETARINPTLSTVFAIARALDIPLSTMFDFSLPINKTTNNFF